MFASLLTKLTVLAEVAKSPQLPAFLRAVSEYSDEAAAVLEKLQKGIPAFAAADGCCPDDDCLEECHKAACEIEANAAKCCERVSATADDKASMDPATILALAQMVMQVLKAIRERRQGK